MKKTLLITLCLSLILGLTACGNASGPSETPPPQTVSNGVQEPAPGAPAVEPSASEGEGDILTVFFSVPEDVSTSGVDAVSGASVVVNEGEVLGNVQYMAQIIQKTAGGDLFRLETVQQYPLEHEALVDQAADEQNADARPELTALPENLEQYSTIFLGYPNWWANLPMPLYTFLERVDLSGKTIIPFCPHGGSRFSHTVETI